ncbi:MAG: pyruvate kinase, partial [Candidatus Krumholzibacteria bacterium]|nr:pyruvate kinase [Candidatus Krumholzibacteria bacterium]
MKRTRIVCTIGPASRDEATLRRMFEAGMDVARLNFSHGTHEEHARAHRLVRGLGPRAAIMQDLQGPKIRLGELPGPGVKVEEGDEVILSVAKDPGGDVPVDYPHLPGEVVPGDDIFVSDGVIHLRVERALGERVFCRVAHGGVLASRKGVNLPGVRISAPALTARDRDDLAFGLGLGVDYVALSFVRSAEEVAELRGLISKAGSKAGVVAKIEKREALEEFEAILEQADAVMIARGDLGVEIPIDQVPFVQKRLIRRCLQAGKPVITATQMLESMVSSELPTRAETSDVANAILDGSDAVMLSAETATGRAPDRTVEIMRRIIETAEEYAAERPSPAAPDVGIGGGEQDALTDAVCAGAVETAEAVGAK